jgi:hypothetical protein
MRCEDLDLSIEELAVAADADRDTTLHVESCALCQARLRLAHAIERSLESRERPDAPPRFTTSVMARVRRERWRAEQIVDTGFNIAVGFGVLFVLGGLAALAWSLEWYSVSPAVLQVARDLSSQWIVRVQEQLAMMAIAAAILSSALVLWRWVEGGNFER